MNNRLVMKSSGPVCNIFTSVISLFLIAEGIWGFNSEVIFGIFTTNILHAIVHLILGLMGLVLAWAGITRRFNLFLGILLTVVGILRFVPGADQIVINLFNVNPAVAYFNIAVGVFTLIIVFTSGPRKRRVR